MTDRFELNCTVALLVTAACLIEPIAVRKSQAAALDAFDPEEIPRGTETAPQYSPASARVHLKQGAGKVAKRQFQEALADFNEAIRVDPQNSEAFAARGAVWLDLRNTDKALEDLTEAIRLDPQSAHAYCDRARAWLAKEREPMQQFFKRYLGAVEAELKTSDGTLVKSIPDARERGLSDLDHALKIDPKFVRARTLRGTILLEKAEWAMALEDFDTALELDPKATDALWGRARIRATAADKRFRDGQEAVELATKAAMLSDWKNPAILETLAAACSETGEFKSAVRWQAQALKLLTPSIVDRIFGEDEDEDAADARKAARTRLEAYKSGKSAVEFEIELAKARKADQAGAALFGDSDIPAANANVDEKTVPLVGTLVDVQGNPLPHAKVISLGPVRDKEPPPEISGGLWFTGLEPLLRGATEHSAVADAHGKFELKKGPQGAFVIGQMTALRIVAEAGQVFDVNAIVAAKTVVRVPTLTGVDVSKVQNVAAGEMAGLVVDAAGRPLEGVEIAVGIGDPHIDLKTAADGTFRTTESRPGEERQAAVFFYKSGYAREAIYEAPTGVAGWVIVLGPATGFEGVVRRQDGTPAGGVLVQAVSGQKHIFFMGSRYPIFEHRFETTSDAEGRYRILLQSDEYEIDVRVSGVGSARLSPEPLLHGRMRPLDVILKAGATLRVKILDSQTRAPVSGIVLREPPKTVTEFNLPAPGLYSHVSVPGRDRRAKFEGKSDAAGEIVIAGLLPGEYLFDVTAPGYARWWSESDSSYTEKKANPDPVKYVGHDRGRLVFSIENDTKPVEILVEKEVRIRGRVVDPDGVAVSRAVVVLSQPGFGDYRSGWSREVHDRDPKSDEKGQFEMFIPASNDLRYNLVALDFPTSERRRWANGVSQPFRTRPGDVIKDLKLVLTRPAAVRGKVLDQNGQPSYGTRVTLFPVDDLEESTYPQMSTKADGLFDFPVVRPGQYFFGAETTGVREWRKKITLKEGETISNFVIKAPGDEPHR